VIGLRLVREQEVLRGPQEQQKGPHAGLAVFGCELPARPLELVGPVAHGEGVALGVVFEHVEIEARPRHLFEQLRHVDVACAARPDVTSQEGADLVRAALGAEVGIEAGLGFQVFGQKPQCPAVVGEVLEAAHEDGAVEPAARSIVEEVHLLHAAGQLLLANQVTDEALLLARERDRMHVDAAEPRILQERPPAAAHVEDARARLECERIDRVLELAGLGRCCRVFWRGIEAVRIGTPTLEPGQKEASWTVVMKADRVAIQPAPVLKQQSQRQPEPFCGARAGSDHVGELHDLQQVAFDVDLPAQVGFGQAQ